MKQIKYFIAGIVTILFAKPIANNLLELILLWIEVLKETPIKKILESEKDLTVLREFLQPTEEIYDCQVENYSDDDEE